MRFHFSTPSSAITIRCSLRKNRHQCIYPENRENRPRLIGPDKTSAVINRYTGELIPVYVFVATLSYSQYAYVEGFLSQNQESWIEAHVHMFEYFQGVTRMIVPDNLKTGVTKPDWYSPVINRTYHELAEYYNTAIIPARVRKPKDKPNAERTVGVISTWIIASLRRRQFFSLGELNEAIREKLKEFNSREFQKKTGSRLSVFLAEEKPMLQRLTAAPFELALWKQATVQFNYHISVEKNLYSVPYEYIKQKVDVRITERVVEVFFNHIRICSHPRIRGKIGNYSTSEAHMPADHREYVSWNGERFLSWAQKIGPATMATVKSILSTHKIEQQGYRSCMGLLKLADKYSITRLEAACSKALSYTPHPSFKSVKTILSTGQDNVVSEGELTQVSDSSPHGFTRGVAYYGRTDK